MANINKKIASMRKNVEKATSKYRELGGLSAEVGLPNDRIHGPSGLPLAMLGAIHEFGTDTIPERSFLRGTVFHRKHEINDGLRKVSIQVSKGKSPEGAMEAFALVGAGMVQDYISAGIDPPTGAGRTPLIDTGAMRQGIIGRVVKI